MKKSNDRASVLRRRGAISARCQARANLLPILALLSFTDGVSRMNVLLNTSTIVIGGALQASLHFIRQSLDAPDDIRWSYVLSGALTEQLHHAGIPLPDASRPSWVMPRSPAISLAARRNVKRIERQIRPDLVFTFFGPSYVVFDAPHVCGVADPWVTHPNPRAYRTLKNVWRRAEYWLRSEYKIRWFKTADYWMTEAMIAKRGMVQRLHVSDDAVAIVPNSCGDQFRQMKHVDRVSSDRLRLLYISSYYPHKNFEIIPEVAQQITTIAPSLRFQFVLTLPEDSREYRNIARRANALGVGASLCTVGTVPVARAVELYSSSDLAFIPTVLETFSATYPEAMAAELPIVTTDMDFARDVCGDAAAYFNPDSPADAAAKIVALAGSPDRRNLLIQAGKRQVARLPTASEKYGLYVKALRGFLDDYRNSLTAK